MCAPYKYNGTYIKPLYDVSYIIGAELNVTIAEDIFLLCTMLLYFVRSLMQGACIWNCFPPCDQPPQPAAYQKERSKPECSQTVSNFTI